MFRGIIGLLVFQFAGICLKGSFAAEEKCWGQPRVHPFEVTVVDAWEDGATIFLKIAHENDALSQIRINMILSRLITSETRFMSWSSKRINAEQQTNILSVQKNSISDVELAKKEISVSFILNKFENLNATALIEFITLQTLCNKTYNRETIEAELTTSTSTPEYASAATIDQMGVTNENEENEVDVLANVIDPNLVPMFENPKQHGEFSGDDKCPYIPSVPGESGLYTKQNIWPEGDGGFVFEAFMNLEYPSLNTWTIKLVFSQPVSEIRVWNAVAIEEELQDGYVWYLSPLGYNFKTDLLQFNMHMKLMHKDIPNTWMFLCNDGLQPSPEIVIPPWDFERVLDESQFELEMENSQRPTDAIYEMPAEEYIAVDDESNIDFMPQKTGVDLSREFNVPLPNPFCNDYDTDQPELSNRNSAPNCKPSPPEDGLKYDYNVLLCMSILFYEAQRSGVIPIDSRIPWRGNSSLQDGCFTANGKEPNLSGGWYNSGDNKKFGFPMASAVTVLAWGMVEFRDAYEDAGEWENAKSMLKWAADYFVNAHTAETTLWGQITPFSGDVEELSKTRPEDDTWLNMAYKIDEDNPGSDLAGETAAALAATSIVFRDEDPGFANDLIWHAYTLYEFADNFRGFYHDSIPEVADYYYSFGDYTDEIVWGCIWVARGLQNTTLLKECTNKYDEFQLQHQNPYEFSWALKTPGINVLLAQFTEKNIYIQKVEEFFDHTLRFDRTPGGLSFVLKYGANRYAANLATIAVMAAKTVNKLPNSDDYLKYAEEQIHALAGDGDGKRSYVVGFGSDYPKRYIHIASACPISEGKSTEILPCSVTNLYDNNDNANVLYGALVGGPTNTRGSYIDSPENTEGNSVGVDYNAGFQTAVAGLKHYALMKRI